MANGPMYLSSAVGDRAAFDLLQCYDEGVMEGINRVWRFNPGPNGVTLPNIFDAIRVAPSGTAENVYTYASSNYSQPDTGGDEIPDFVSSLYEHTIQNRRPKKRGLKVDLVDWSDDKIGKYRVMFHEAGTASVVAPYRLLVNTMRNARLGGLSANAIMVSGIDNVPFFGTHYAIPGDNTSPTWINSYVRPALTRPVFAEMWGNMILFPGEDSTASAPTVVGACPSVLAVGPLDLDAALDIAYNERPSEGAGGGSVQTGRVEVAFVPEWTDGTWELLDTHSSLERGFIFQEREPNRLFPLATSPTDPIALRQGYLDWLLQGRYDVGIGHPRRVLRVGRVAP